MSEHCAYASPCESQTVSDLFHTRVQSESVHSNALTAECDYCVRTCLQNRSEKENKQIRGMFYGTFTALDSWRRFIITPFNSERNLSD